MFGGTKELGAHQSAELRHVLNFNVSYNYAKEVDENKKIPPSLPKELDALSIKHTVQRRIEACNLRHDLKRRKIDPELALKRASKSESQRKQDLDQLFERFNATRTRRRGKDIKERTIQPKPGSDPRRIIRVREPEFIPTPPDHFDQFCQNVRFKSSNAPKISVRPPPDDKLVKSPPRAKRGKGKKNPPVEEQPIITGPPSKTHQLFVNRSMLMRDGVIDLDNADLMDYIIEKVHDE